MKSNENEQERSWEEELDLTDSARRIIRKLLALEEPYQSCSEIKQDFVIFISPRGGKKCLFLIKF